MELAQGTPSALDKQKQNHFARKQAVHAVVMHYLPLLFLPSIFLIRWNVQYLELFLGTYVLAKLGTTLGYHRMLAHRSFVPSAFVKIVFSVLGSMSGQGPIYYWVATHRHHHRYSDQPEDLHSPYRNSSERTWKGFWESHMGWLTHTAMPNLFRYIPDLLRDPVIYRIHQSYFALVLLSLFLPGLILVWMTGERSQFWMGVLIGGILRMCLQQQTTFLVNSLTHFFGYRNFKTADRSYNNPLVAVLTLGEGWHNNHHAVQQSAKHGLKWFEIDVTYLVIWCLEKLRLVRDVKRGLT